MRRASGKAKTLLHARAGQLGAVFRTVLETLRTLFVWLVDLLLFYTPLGVGKLGEAWGKYSYVQALGCAARFYCAAQTWKHVPRDRGCSLLLVRGCLACALVGGAASKQRLKVPASCQAGL